MNNTEDAKSVNHARGLRLDFASLVGVCLGPTCVLLGQYLEGGDPRSLLQSSAALIVIGSTIAACLLSFAPSSLLAAVRDLIKVVGEDLPNAQDLIERILSYSMVLRKEGPVALQKRAAQEPYPLLATGLNLLASNVPEETLMSVMERIFQERSRANNAGAEVFEAAGGYLPTFGILGAVIGLIHTMHSLADPNKVGLGIATAFVATVYGVGLANLVAFPVAKKIRTRAQQEKNLDKLVIAGIKGIRAGLIGTALRQILVEGTNGADGVRPPVLVKGEQSQQAQAAA